jgi:hypothetical protein
MPGLLGSVLQALKEEGHLVPPALCRSPASGAQVDLMGFREVRQSPHYGRAAVRQLFRRALGRVTQLPADNIQAIGATVSGGMQGPSTAGLLEVLRRHGRLIADYQEDFSGALDLAGAAGSYRALCAHWALAHPAAGVGLELLVTQDHSGVTIYAWPDANAIEANAALRAVEPDARPLPAPAAAPAAPEGSIAQVEQPSAPVRRKLTIPGVDF